jgi:hypothetical protein
MARVVALFDDLLLGSNVVGWLQAGGHEATLAGSVEQAVGAGAAVVVADLNAGSFDPLAVAGTGPRTVGLYSHVDPETKARAEAAGYDLVVPRSRFAREGAALVDRLVG